MKNNFKKLTRNEQLMVNGCASAYKVGNERACVC